ncbi:MAG: YeeE/YedE family protein [Salinibacter sp.]
MTVVIMGALVGLAFGYALQRGRFCVNTAFRDVLVLRNSRLLRAWALAVVVQLIGVQIVVALGWLNPDIPPLWWPANVAGGLLFGVGMVLAGGCASGTCYRVGEGMLGSLTALLGFGLMTVIADQGALQPLQEALRTPVGFDGSAPPLTLSGLVGLPSWLVAGALSALVLAWIARERRISARRGWPWLATGLAIGAVAFVAWLSSSATGRSYGLSITGPIRSLFQYLVTGEASFIDWGSYMLLGLIAGAGLAGLLYGERKLRVPQAGRLLQSLGGGLLMGFGAQVAGGCNIGHSLTGLAVLSAASVITTISIVLGAWAMSFLMFMNGAAVLSRWVAQLVPAGGTQSTPDRQPSPESITAKEDAT